MKIYCHCLNVLINSKGESLTSLGEESDVKAKEAVPDHPFFKEEIRCVELENIYKEQSSLVVVDTYAEWVIHRCINCHLYTHALNPASTITVLVNCALLTNLEEIEVLRKSDKFSPTFHIIINNKKESDEDIPISGGRVPGSAALHQQLTEWLQERVRETEEKVRQFSEQQYAALDRLRTRAHSDHHTLTRILIEANTSQKVSNGSKKPLSQFNVTKPKPASPQRAMPILPDPASAIAAVKRPIQVANRPKNLVRKASVDAEGLFDLEGMDETSHEAFPSDEELSDTDESGSHDEGIHIPRRVSSAMCAKSLPVNVPVFPQHMGSEDDDSFHHKHDYRIPEQPMDIAASIKALAKSVHGDAVFGDLPRPRFSTQI